MIRNPQPIRCARLLSFILLCASPLLADDSIPRPRILGLSHIALYVHDVAKSRAFYKDFLGFPNRSP